MKKDHRNIGVFIQDGNRVKILISTAELEYLESMYRDGHTIMQTVCRQTGNKHQVTLSAVFREIVA